MNIEIDPEFQIEYRREGDGIPVVFLHAFPLTHEMWQPQFPALSSEYSVIAPDMRGFGNTFEFEESEVSIAQMAHDLNTLLDALHVEEPIVLCGLSMGGYVAQRFANEYSARLRGLVLCDTRAEPGAPENQAKRNALIELVKSHGTEAFMEKQLPVLLGETTRRENDKVVEFVRELGAAQKIETIVDGLCALRDRPDARPWLSQIAVPTLLVFGEEDALADPQIIATLENGIADSQTVSIPRAGHLPNLENPTAFNDALLEFLRGNL